VAKEEEGGRSPTQKSVNREGSLTKVRGEEEGLKGKEKGFLKKGGDSGAGGPHKEKYGGTDARRRVLRRKASSTDLRFRGRGLEEKKGILKRGDR